MTVEELIAALGKMPSDATVFVSASARAADFHPFGLTAVEQRADDGDGLPVVDDFTGDESSGDTHVVLFG